MSDIKQSYLRGQTNWDLGEDGLSVFSDLIPATVGTPPVRSCDTCGPTLKMGPGGAKIDEPLTYTPGVYSGSQPITISHVWKRRAPGALEYEVFTDSDLDDNEYIIRLEDVGASFYVEETAVNSVGSITSNTDIVSVPLTGDDIPPLIGGGGFGGATPIPGPVGDLNAKGNILVDYGDNVVGVDEHAARPAARWTELPFITRDDEFYVTVSAYHMEGIERIEFILDNGAPTTIDQTYAHPTDLHAARHEIANGVSAPEGHERFDRLHHYEEYMVKIDPRTAGPDGGPLQNGLHEVRCIVYPVAGQPFVLQGDVGRSGEEKENLFVFGNGHHSFWFNVYFVESEPTGELIVPTKTVGENSDYDSLEALFSDMNSSDPFFQRGGRILLRAGDHALPTSSNAGNVMSNIDTWDGQNKSLYFGNSRNAGTALTIMADPEALPHTVNILPSLDTENFGGDASVYYKGIQFTIISNPKQATCDTEDIDCSMNDEYTLDSRTQPVTAVGGGSASLLLEECRFNGDNAISWTTGDVTGVHGQPGVGVWYKGCMGYIIPNLVGKFVYMCKNSYIVRGSGDHGCCHPASFINHVVYAFKHNPGSEKPGIHSDFLQYSTLIGSTEYKMFVNVDVNGDPIFEWATGRDGPQQSDEDEASGFQAGDYISFTWHEDLTASQINQIGDIEIWMDQEPSGQDGNDVVVECTKIMDDYDNGSIVWNRTADNPNDPAPLSEASMTPGYRLAGTLTSQDLDPYVEPRKRPHAYPQEGREVWMYLQDNWNYNDEVPYNQGVRNFQDGTFEGKKVFWFANFTNNPGPRCDPNETSRGFLDVDSMRPVGPDNRIYAHIYMYASLVQPTQWAVYGGWNESAWDNGLIMNETIWSRRKDDYPEDQWVQRNFFSTNCALVGWELDCSVYETKIGMNFQTPFKHGIFKDMNIRGFAFSPTNQWEGSYPNQHMLFKNSIYYVIDADAAATMNNPDTSILEPIHVVKSQNAQQTDENWPWEGCKISTVKYNKISPPCSLSFSEWEQVLVTVPPESYDPGPFIGYDSVDPETNNSRIETFINPTYDDIPEGYPGHGDPDEWLGKYWNHQPIIDAWENAFQGIREDLSDVDSEGAKNMLMGSPYEDISVNSHGCGCLSLSGYQDERGFFKPQRAFGDVDRGNPRLNGVENTCMYYNASGRDKRDRCVCPLSFSECDTCGELEGMVGCGEPYYLYDWTETDILNNDAAEFDPGL